MHMGSAHESIYTTAPRQSVVTGFAHPARNVAALRVEPGMHVADFGSGSGAYVFEIADALSGSGHIYAIDIQRDLLHRIRNEATRRKLPNVEILWGDLEKSGGSKLAESSIDLVLISNTLFQIHEKAIVLAEARRILKDSGRLAIIDWSDSFGGTGPQSQDVVKKEAALSLAQKCGFEMMREFPAGSHHWGVILRKQGS